MLKIYFTLTIAAHFIISNNCAQPTTDTLLSKILSTSSNSITKSIVADPLKYRCQIIYTQINRNSKGIPTFKNYYFNNHAALYFNPASMVKMPLAFLSLEKIKEIKVKGINKFTGMQFDSSYEQQVAMKKDTTAKNQLPSIAHFIKRALLISENDPYNRMYQFVGQEAINHKLHQKGYTTARITRQFMGYSEEQNRHTNGIQFINGKQEVVHQQPPAYNKEAFNFSQNIKVGKAHWDRNDSLIQEPFEFTKHNHIALQDFQQMLQSVLFPSSVPSHQRFNLTDDDRLFLLKYLSQYPSETDFPKYDTTLFYDSYVKFFFRDSSNKIPPYIRIFNKVGWAYGFSTDVSYIVDTKNNIDFMLAATIYVNSDEVVNDSKYDYETVGQPFMHDIGQLIYQFELNRKHDFKPKLNAFNIQYDKRDINDKRPMIQLVDN